jgi:alkylresorcinol/alkylpyrone synthase
MAKLIGTGTCSGKIRLSQGEIKRFIHNLFSSYPDIDKMINVFDNADITQRYISVPVEWFSSHHSFSDRNKLYREEALSLSIKAITDCFLNTGISAEDIDCIIYVSSTGVSTPSIDAFIINELDLNSHVKRIPIWGLGCAGGAAGISRAMEYVKANPKHNCLLVAAELCSLTFQKDDLSKSNIVAASLFSDGCAAAVIAGKEAEYFQNKGIELINSLSTIYQDTIDVMGWDIVDDGFRVVFSRDIPSIVKEYVKTNIQELLKLNGLGINDIEYLVTHPGGLKVINAYEESLNLKPGYLKYSRKVLTGHGNMSAPSVLYVLKDFFDNNEFQKDNLGIISALGPGFSSELVLFKAS